MKIIRPTEKFADTFGSPIFCLIFLGFCQLLRLTVPLPKSHERPWAIGSSVSLVHTIFLTLPVQSRYLVPTPTKGGGG